MKKTIKTITLFLLVVAMLISLIGCGSEENKVFYTSSDFASEENKVFYTASDFASDILSSGLNGEDVNNKFSDSFNDLDIYIKKANNFADGVAWVQLKVVNYSLCTDVEYQALIDTSGKILFDMPLSSNDEFLPYKNGLSVKKEKINKYDYAYKSVYDKKGNKIISPEKHGYENILAFSDDNKYFIVYKIEKNFMGDVYMIGIIDNKGEYVQELSASNPIAVIGQELLEYGKKLEIKYIEKDIFKVDTDYYHINRNIMTKNYEHIEVEQYIDAYKYDEEGNSELIFDEFELWGTTGNVILVSNDKEECMLIDYDGNIIMDFSKYNLTGEMWMELGEIGYYNSEGYFCTQIENSTGDFYLCLFNPDGEMVFDPIRREANTWLSPLNNKGFVYAVTNKNKTIYYLYQCDGTIKELKYGDADIWQQERDLFEYGLELVNTKNETFYINENEEIVITEETLNEKNFSRYF